MSKIKALFGATVMVGLLAITATSASAFFSATNGESTSGTGSAGVTLFTDQSATVECESASGTWKLPKATESETVNLHVAASTAKPAGWKECHSSISKLISAEVSECELQIKETSKLPGKGLGSVITGCTVTVTGDCRIKVPTGKANEGLKEILSENKKPIENLLSTVNVVGITSEAESLGGLGCVGIKTPKNAEGTEKGKVTGTGLKES